VCTWGFFLKVKKKTKKETKKIHDSDQPFLEGVPSCICGHNRCYRGNSRGSSRRRTPWGTRACHIRPGGRIRRRRRYTPCCHAGSLRSSGTLVQTTFAFPATSGCGRTSCFRRRCGRCSRRCCRRPCRLADAVPPTPAAGSLAAALVACAPCSLPAWRRAATRGRWFVVGHFFHQVECCLGLNVFVRMDRVRRPAHADGLRHLLLAVAPPADQLKAVHHHSRCNCFPYLKLELCQVTQK
jgi:hypothetical protein